MPESERLARVLRRMALWCAVLVLTITSLSAFLRITRAGLGCDDWPQCYGQALAAQQQGLADPRPAGAAAAVARLAHRVTASATLLLIVGMVVVCLSMRPRPWRAGALALALLGLALFLAVLGRWSAAARIPAVTIGNLLAGFLMVAIAWQIARPARPAAAAPDRARALRWSARIGVVLVLAQVALGGLVSAGYAGLGCPGLFDCDGRGLPWHALDPFAEPVLAAAAPGNAAAVLLQQVHRTGAVLAVALLLPVGLVALRRGFARTAVVLLVLLALQVALGVGLVVFALPLPVALAHNLVAGLLLAACVDLAFSPPTLR